MKRLNSSCCCLILIIVLLANVKSEEEITSVKEGTAQNEAEPLVIPGLGNIGFNIGFGINSYNGPFRCTNRFPGYYGDIDRNCQYFHMCEPSGRWHYMQCPPGTFFNQWSLVCDYGYNYNCRQYGPQHYIRNEHFRPFYSPFDNRRPFDRDNDRRQFNRDDRRPPDRGNNRRPQLTNEEE